MVVPCLTCLHRDGYKYAFNEETQAYEYHLTCKNGVQLPVPVPKFGFTCDKYESRKNLTPTSQRSECAIEVDHS